MISNVLSRSSDLEHTFSNDVFFMLYKNIILLVANLVFALDLGKRPLIENVKQTIFDVTHLKPCNDSKHTL
jgi:hypothetical protein